MLLPTTRIGRKRNLNRTKLARTSTISRATVQAGRRPISILPHQEVTSSGGFLLASACTADIHLNTALTIQFRESITVSPSRKPGASIVFSRPSGKSTCTSTGNTNSHRDYEDQNYDQFSSSPLALARLRPAFRLETGCGARACLAHLGPVNSPSFYLWLSVIVSRAFMGIPSLLFSNSVRFSGQEHNYEDVHRSYAHDHLSLESHLNGGQRWRNAFHFP